MNKFFSRPLSPHLTVYSLQESSLSSIWHRLSAMFLVVLITCLFMVQKLFFWANNSSSLYTIICILNQATNSYAIFVLYVVISYHVLNGTRHLLWDLGLILTTKSISKSNLGMTFMLCFLQFLFYKNFLL